MAELDLAGVERAIPHRPPFLFVDEVLEITPDKAVARRTIRADEPHFAGHYPGNPIMPGVLLCESVFQTAAIYMSHRLEREGAGDLNSRTPVLARILGAKFKQMVKPGDVITLEATYKQTVSSFYFMTGKALRDGKVVMTVDYALAMVEEK